MSRILLLSVAAALVAAGQCIEVAGDRVRASDLAPVIPEFSGVAPETEIAISPLPGAVRQLRAADLSRVLGSPVAAAACVVRKTRELSADEVLSAMRTSIPDTGVRLSIVDFSRTPVPPGTVEFPLSGLAPASSPETPVTWRGRVHTGEGRTTPVWARVRVSRTMRVLVARRNLRAGELIGTADIEERIAASGGLATPAAPDTQALANSEAARDIAEGTILRPSMLRAKTAVRKGDTLRVVVTGPGAQLKFDTAAESTARVGDRVLVRNPLNGRLIAAIVRGTGEASIELSPERHVQ